MLYKIYKNWILSRVLFVLIFIILLHHTKFHYCYFEILDKKLSNDLHVIYIDPVLYYNYADDIILSSKSDAQLQTLFDTYWNYSSNYSETFYLLCDLENVEKEENPSTAMVLIDTDGWNMIKIMDYSDGSSMDVFTIISFRLLKLMKVKSILYAITPLN